MSDLILVVDDHASSRDALSTLLRDAGYETRPAADAANALDLLSRSPIDLALLDIGLPRVSGLDLLEKIRRTRSAVELPVIMVAAAGERRDGGGVSDTRVLGH
jgi:DNA-binding response OmpR family regulator